MQLRPTSAHKATISMTVNRSAVFLLAFVVALLCNSAWADTTGNSTIVLPPESLPTAIGGQFQYVTDRGARLNIDAVRSLSETEWRSPETANPNFGFTDNAYWFRGDIQHTGDEAGDWKAIVIIAGTAAVLSPFIPYQYTIQVAAAAGFICVIVAQISGLYVWYRGYKPAAFYSLAFATVLMGTAMMILNKFGFLPLNAFTENGQQIGSLAQLVLLSFALAYRIKVLRDETEEAQLQATTMLEGRVRERTLELEEANTKLQELSSRDPLTGTMNRRYFDEQLVAEWNRSLREQVEISVIMLDIDHFKSFNDTYGHQTGDDCLVFLVGHVQASVLRATDVVVRYGGEEFAVVLPGTDAEGAETVAVRIKEKLDRNPFPIGDSTVPITVSQGICTMVPQLGEKPETLIKRADQALYQAKDEGRDRWLHYQKDTTPES